MIHFTNGDSAAGGIREAGVPGEVIPWRDVLHDGPVPADISFNQLRAVRARFISDAGWASFEETLKEFSERDRALERSLGHGEVVLWFEHDLYDQLQLVQLLDWFTTSELGATKLTLICNAEYLGELKPAELAERFPLRSEVTDAQLDVARRAWKAFRAPDPSRIEEFLASDSGSLPYLHGALVRHLEQFPSTVNGLSRTESQAITVLSSGTATLSDAFVEANDKLEDPKFLGDSSFADYIAGLSSVKEPLVVTSDGRQLKAPVPAELWHVPLRLTNAGHGAAVGEADHVRLNGIDRWYGGVHLEGAEAQWRWDPILRALQAHE